MTDAELRLWMEARRAAQGAMPGRCLNHDPCPHRGLLLRGVQRWVCCFCLRRWVEQPKVQAPRPRAMYAFDAVMDGFARKPRTGSSR